MNDIVNNWLLLTREVVTFTDQTDHHLLSYVPPRPVLRCASGLVLSIQASETHYCSPRNDTGPYTAVEIMLIKITRGSTLPDRFETYAEDDYLKEDGVLGYVPVELVNQVIEDNGGIDFISMSLAKEKEDEI